MRRMRQNLLGRGKPLPSSERKTIQPKAAVASCFAMTLSAYNGTPVQPQSQAMGTASREPRRGQPPGVCCQAQFNLPPRSGEAVPNTDQIAILAPATVVTCNLKEKESAGKAVLGLPWQKYGCGSVVSISLPRSKQERERRKAPPLTLSPWNIYTSWERRKGESQKGDFQ